MLLGGAVDGDDDVGEDRAQQLLALAVAAKRRSTVTAVAPQRETHTAQNVGVRTSASASRIALPPITPEVKPAFT